MGLQRGRSKEASSNPLELQVTRGAPSAGAALWFRERLSNRWCALGAAQPRPQPLELRRHSRWDVRSAARLAGGPRKDPRLQVTGAASGQSLCLCELSLNSSPGAVVTGDGNLAACSLCATRPAAGRAGLGRATSQPLVASKAQALVSVQR